MGGAAGSRGPAVRLHGLWQLPAVQQAARVERLGGRGCRKLPGTHLHRARLPSCLACHVGPLCLGSLDRQRQCRQQVGQRLAGACVAAQRDVLARQHRGDRTGLDLGGRVDALGRQWRLQVARGQEAGRSERGAGAGSRAACRQFWRHCPRLQVTLPRPLTSSRVSIPSSLKLEVGAGAASSVADAWTTCALPLAHCVRPCCRLNTFT